MKKLILIMLLTTVANLAMAQYSAVRVNTLGLATGTLNVGVDVAVAQKWSVDLAGYWNPISTTNLQSQALGITAGVRRWRFEPHVGAFWGVHSLVARYDVGNTDHHFKGWITGVGASYGYSWMLAKRWNFTLEGGLGCFFVQDRKQKHVTPDDEDMLIFHRRRTIISPSKLEVSFSYLF